MARFLIKEADPIQYKTEIVDFWMNYLPGTPPERFDWMDNNPDGKPIWYLAFEKDGNKLAGTVSIMPRIMVNNGKTLRAGIIGDFMIGDKYRVYGPALDLQKAVVASLKNHNLDFLYTLPNKASLKINERSGLRKVTDLDYYVKPTYVAYYLEKYLNHSVARVISPIVKVLLAIGSKETYMTSGGIFQEIKDIGGSFDTLWNRIKEKRAYPMGNRGAEYLRWRYLKDPLLDFQIITFQEKPDGEMSGYIVFTIIDHKMEIFDLVGLRQAYEEKLMKRTISLAKEKKIRSICIRLSSRNDFYKRIKKFGFFRTKSDACVLAYGMTDSFSFRWPYMEGDRNI